MHHRCDKALRMLINQLGEKRKILIKFKHPNSAQCTLSLMGKVRNIFVVNVGRYTKTVSEQRIVSAFAKSIWDEATQRLLAT